MARGAFAPIVTSKIRVYITAALNGYGRVMEVEAWGVSAAANVPPAVSITNPMKARRSWRRPDLQVTVTATDEDGTSQQVDFFVDGVLSGSSTRRAVQRLNWSSVGHGSAHTDRGRHRQPGRNHDFGAGARDGRRGQRASDRRDHQSCRGRRIHGARQHHLDGNGR